MPELTAQQAEFAREYVRNSGDGTAAAIHAGFSEKSAAQRAYELRQKPHVQEAIYREQRRTFAELASISLGQARLMLLDPKTPPGARADLIKTMLDRAGHGVKRDGDAADEGEEKDLRRMTLDELEALALKVRDGRSAEAGD